MGEAFLLGNSAILTNVCLLPLYPGLIAFLAGNADNKRSRRATGWLGIFVLVGVLTTMTLVGVVLFLLQQSFHNLLVWLLPVVYAIVIILGVLMLIGINPFDRIRTLQAPILQNPYLTAYLYGILLGPMTLPCTGPIILSAFLVGASMGTFSAFADGILYFLVFGLGFGWPLVLLPLLAMPLQRQFTGWLTKNHHLLTRISGTLLMLIGAFGVYTELF